MPKVKHGDFLRMLEASSTFSFRVVEGRLGKSYAKIFIHNLRKRGRIMELIRGWYTFSKSPYLITIPLGEAYVGLGTAAHIHGAWNQVPNIDILTTRAPGLTRSGERLVGGSKVIVRRIDRRMYFGYQHMALNEAVPIRVSDPEKTLIDLLYFNYPYAEEIIPELMRIAKKEKVLAYLKSMGNLRGAKNITRKLGLIYGIRDNLGDATKFI